MFDNLLQTAIVVNLLAATVRIATPLLFGALGEVITERAGVMNLGLEGSMLMAAFVGFLVAERTGSVLLAVLMASLAAALVNLLLGVLAISLDADQTVTGLAINLLSSGLTLFWFRAAYTQYNTAGTPLIEVMGDLEIPFLSTLPVVGEVLFSHKILTYLAFLLVPLVSFLMYRTHIGLQIRSLGEDPRAADMAGIPVHRLRYLAVLAGGLIVGLGGAFVSVGSVERFFPDMTAGRGWLAFVIVIAGNWKPTRILVVTLVFSLLGAIQLQAQGIGVQVPYQVLLGLPYLVAILAMIIGRARSVAPECLGVPYTRE